MSEHRAEIVWTRDGDFAAGQYTRAHVWRFDGGIEVPASPSISVMPPPLGREDAVDPEEALVAALSSCHMLSFLHVARRAGFVVESYRDAAVGRMARLGPGRHWVERVDLNPTIVFSGETPDRERLVALHDEAHRICFIANSVRSEVVVNIEGEAG